MGETMRLASVVVHNNAAVSTVIKSDSGFLRTSSFSSITCSEWTRFQLISSSYPGGLDRARRYNQSAITFSRNTEHDESSSTSEGDMMNSPVNVGSNDFEKSVTSSIGDSLEGKQGPHDNVSSVRTVALCVLTAVAFGVGLGLKDGPEKATEFFAGYLLEQSLSVDNLFVFVLIFKYFKVPIAYQNRVLSYGIAGAIIFRLSIILLGTATLQRFDGVKLLLAAVLLYSAFKLFAEEEEDSDLSDNFIVKTCRKFIPVTSNYDGDRFITVQDGIWKATPLLLTVAVIELSDIAFAVDSIPAVFVLHKTLLSYLHPIFFAILGLRSLYTLVSGSMLELEYLQPAIGVVLGFVGCKMILDFFGIHVSTEVSLGFVATSLGTGVALSLLKNKSDDDYM